MFGQLLHCLFAHKSDCAVFVAVGIDAETGRRMVLGVSVGLSEAAEHWAAFIQSLMMRGMNRPNFRADKQYKLADWVEENIEECLTVIDCPPEVQRRLRTPNIMESINRQLKRRTIVISIFPSEASLLRIVTGPLRRMGGYLL